MNPKFTLVLLLVLVVYQETVEGRAMKRKKRYIGIANGGECDCGGTEGYFECDTCYNNKGLCDPQTTTCPSNKDGYCKRTWKTDDGDSNGNVIFERWECATDGQCHLNEDVHTEISPGGSPVFEHCDVGVCQCDADPTCVVPTDNHGDWRYEEGGTPVSPAAVGTIIKLVCPDGYQLSPAGSNGRITCTANSGGTAADWNPTPPPTCVAMPLTCDVPQVSNGAYSYNGATATSPIAAGQSITLECNDGYDMVPPITDGSIACTASGDGTSAGWVPSPPSCLHNDCYGVTCSGHGDCVDVTPHDEVYTCNCDAGYTGPDCGARLTCNVPQADNGVYKDGDDTAVSPINTGNSITLVCSDGYRLDPEGSSGAITCTTIDSTSADWRPTPLPTCVRIKCTVPSNPAHGHWNYSPDTEVDYHTVITLICDSEFGPAGSTSTCTENGWSPMPLTCQRTHCARPSEGHGTWTGDPLVPIGSTITLTCDGGYGPSGSATTDCTSNNWSPVPSTCIPKCSDPDGSGTNVGWTPGPINGYHTVGTVLTFSCLSGDGYTLEGAETSTCKSDCADCAAYWSPAELPTCYSYTVGPCGVNNSPCPPETTCQDNAEGHNCIQNGNCYCGSSSPVGYFVCYECQSNTGPCTGVPVECPANKDGYCKHRWTTNGEIESERRFCATDGQCHDSEDQHSATESPGGSKLYEDCTPGICHCDGGVRKKRSVKVH